MEKKNYILSLFLIVFIVGYMACEKEKTMVKPPVAKKIEKKLIKHGDVRIDNYYWLNERDNPEVIEYLKAENNYTKEMMKHTEKLQEKLYKEIIGRFKQNDESVPYFKNGYYYYSKYEEGKEYPIYCRKKGSLNAKEEVMLNVNEMAKGHNYYAVVGLSVSPDNKLLSFGVDTVGRRKYVIHFKNLKTGEILPDKVENTTGSSVWANDNKTVFYTIKDKTLRSYKIVKHLLGTMPDKDTVAYHEQDPTFDVFVYKTKSDKYIIIGSSSTMSDEYRFIDASKPNDKFKIIQKRERGLEYSVNHFENYFYIVTNLDAKNFKLVKTSVNKTSKENWEDVIPYNEQVFMEGIDIFKNYLVVSMRENGLPMLKVINWNKKEEHYIKFDEETYAVYTSYNPEFNTDILRFNYTSLTTPNSTYDYNMKTKERKLLKRQEVVGDFKPENYESKRLFATAKDGVKVPISIVYKKGLKKDGKNPLLLYGYGSYGYSMEPYFSSVRLSLLDRGFVYAIAHIRGGQEMGRSWYEDGKLLKKKNTFTDFIACGEYLVKEKFTSPDRLFAEGGSAGGLLMGAVVNMKPELFKGVIAAVPFVDVVTTMLDDTIPLTTAEYDEWGNPNIEKYYFYMKSYSPYDNVEAKDYPAMLVTTGLHDSQVQYFEPAKWVAKLRDLKTDNNLLIFDIDMESGHGGTTGRFKRYKRTALEYAFLLDLAGIKN